MSKKRKKRRHNQAKNVTVNREYKSAVFKMLFSEKKNALSLYNALNGSDYKDVDQLVINSLENSIYLKIYNDVSFIIGGTVNLYEHQSTVNPNMPLRDLFYIMDIYKKMVPKRDLYGSKLISIPTPQFIVFYNGPTNISDEQILKLSDSFIQKTNSPELELTVRVLNVNYGHNKDLMDRCTPLRDYSILNQRVRDNLKSKMPIEEAVDKAVTSCIKDHILEDFLIKERSGVIHMHILDFNEELHEQSLREEGREQGLEQGREQGQAIGQRLSILNLLELRGPVSPRLRSRLDAISDPTELSALLIAAAQAESPEAFEKLLP